ncbi:MAG: signal peptidase I [bacterium]
MKKELEKIVELNEFDMIEINESSAKIVKRILYVSVVVMLLFMALFLATLICNRSHSSLAIANRDSYLIIILFLFLFSAGFTAIIYFVFKNNESLIKLKVLATIYRIYDIFVFGAKVITIMMFCFLYVCAPAKISGDSMEGSYQNNDTVLVWNLFYKPKLNDVVIIDTSDSPVLKNSDYIIKRIVATANDKVEYRSNSLYVNDLFVESLTSEEYYMLLTCLDTKTTYVTVPSNFVIVLGDNRDNSTDSRQIGLIDIDNIIGKSIFRILPFSNIGFPSKEVL